MKANSLFVGCWNTADAVHKVRAVNPLSDTQPSTVTSNAASSVLVPVVPCGDVFTSPYLETICWPRFKKGRVGEMCVCPTLNVAVHRET